MEPKRPRPPPKEESEADAAEGGGREGGDSPRGSQAQGAHLRPRHLPQREVLGHPRDDVRDAQGRVRGQGPAAVTPQGQGGHVDVRSRAARLRLVQDGRAAANRPHARHEHLAERDGSSSARQTRPAALRRPGPLLRRGRSVAARVRPRRPGEDARGETTRGAVARGGYLSRRWPRATGTSGSGGCSGWRSPRRSPRRWRFRTPPCPRSRASPW